MASPFLSTGGVPSQLPVTTCWDVWDLESGQILETFTCDAGLACCAVADNWRIVAGHRGGKMRFLVLGTRPHGKLRKSQSDVSASTRDDSEQAY